MATATTDVRTEWVEYPNEGTPISAYLAQPAQAGVWPTMLLVHENPGLTEHRQDVTRRIAALGYVALTPNLYSRLGGKAPTNESDLVRKRAIAAAVPDEQVCGDLLSGVEYLRQRPEANLDRLGLFGFCMGGSKGFYTVTHSDLFRCYMDFYGPVIARAELQPDRKDHSYLPFVSQLSCPMQYHSGDRDTACPPNEVAMLRQELEKQGKRAEFFLYPGVEHAFHSDTEPRYHPEAAALAWERAVAFLEKHLKA